MIEKVATYSRVVIDPGDFCDGCGRGGPAFGVCIHPPATAPSRKVLVLCDSCAHGSSNVVVLATTLRHTSRDARNFPGGQIRDLGGVLAVDE